MHKKLLVLVLGLTAIALKSAHAQGDGFIQKNRLGFVTGIGNQYLGQLVGGGSKGFNVANNYYYHVTFYELEYYRTLKKKRSTEWDILVQPQYNTNRYGMYPTSVSADFLSGYEYGINLGLLYRKNLTSLPLNVYASLSTGPHYASGTPHRQMSGFLFSDNLFAGANLKLYRNIYADVRLGLRHMSNAGTRLPNAGVNTLALKEGFVVGF
ncbi:acyloxyacyl hydrolase [Mucilaginibacter sp. dw_454]|uniref:acyloxyacyl hydrolase n=1 Tax=Mucilaginibacter sp. dw_454 TaxID=2720079 RepID=UPI001BD66729|nr:acyloxyacyl hydrolase [Mucilaginibacter sp. dw_454]